jgi:hypothetical protein
MVCKEGGGEREREREREGEGERERESIIFDAAGRSMCEAPTKHMQNERVNPLNHRAHCTPNGDETNIPTLPLHDNIT